MVIGSITRFLLGALAVVLYGVITACSSSEPLLPVSSSAQPSSTPEIQFDGLSMIVLGKDGKQYVLKATSLMAYEGESSQLTDPSLRFRKNNVDWSVSAKAGQILGQKKVQLEGTVQIAQAYKNGFGNMQADTAVLDLENETITAAGGLRIVQADVVIAAEKMALDLNAGLVRFEGGVRGEYVLK